MKCWICENEVTKMEAKMVKVCGCLQPYCPKCHKADKKEEDMAKDIAKRVKSYAR